MKIIKKMAQWLRVIGVVNMQTNFVASMDKTTLRYVCAAKLCWVEFFNNVREAFLERHWRLLSNDEKKLTTPVAVVALKKEAHVCLIVHPDDYQKAKDIVLGKKPVDPVERIANILEYNVELVGGGREVQEAKNDFGKRQREEEEKF